ncbi:conserved phage C-terminal domain-containing protein, partial [Ornithobacterium rhinotracheale]
MNYIELINHFWALNKEYSFTPNEKAIYFSLLNKCNELGWKNPFNQSNEYLDLDSGVAKPSIQRAKNTLKQKGLISFKQGNGRSNNTEYEILKQK